MVLYMDDHIWSATAVTEAVAIASPITVSMASQSQFQC